MKKKIITAALILAMAAASAQQAQAQVAQALVFLVEAAGVTESAAWATFYMNRQKALSTVSQNPGASISTLTNDLAQFLSFQWQAGQKAGWVAWSALTNAAQGVLVQLDPSQLATDLPFGWGEDAQGVEQPPQNIPPIITTINSVWSVDYNGWPAWIENLDATGSYGTVAPAYTTISYISSEQQFGQLVEHNIAAYVRTFLNPSCGSDDSCVWAQYQMQPSTQWQYYPYNPDNLYGNPSICAIFAAGAPNTQITQDGTYAYECMKLKDTSSETGSANPTCAVGYTYNENSAICNLTDATAAATAQLPPQGPCHVFRNKAGQFYTIPGDPTCGPSNTQIGNSGMTVTDAEASGAALQVTVNPDGTLNVVQDTPYPSTGTTRDERTVIGPSSSGGLTVQGNQVSWYPGTGVGASPIQSPTTATTALPSVQTSNPAGDSSLADAINALPGEMPGTATNPMVIDSDGHGVSDLDSYVVNTDTTFSPITSFLNPIQQVLNPFSNFAFPAHTSECPSMNLSFTYGFSAAQHITQVNETGGALCDLLTQNQSFIQGFVMFLYILSGIFIVLGA